MPVPTTRDDLNVTESLNSPAGSEAIGTSLDNYIRAHAAIIKQYVIDIADGTSASKGSSLVGFLQSGTGATARTLQAKNREFFSVKDFGAIGNGVADDTAAIQSALAALAAVGGGDLVFPPGVYKVTSAISQVFPNSAIVRVVGYGAKIDGTSVTGGSAGDTVLVTLGGSRLTSSALGADVSLGAEIITSAGTFGVQSNDILLVTSTDLRNPTRPTYYKGELVEVASVSGTTINTSSPLHDAYAAATTTIHRLSMPSVSVEGIEIEMNANQIALAVEYSRSVSVSRVNVHGARYTNVLLRYCYGGNVDSCYLYDAWYSGTGTSYNVSFASCQGVSATNNKLSQARHNIATGGTEPSRRLIYSGNTCTMHPLENKAMSIDIHGNAELVEVIGNNAEGISCAGVNVSIIGNTITSTENHPLLNIFQEINADYYIISDNYINARNGSANGIWVSPNVAGVTISRLVISGNTIVSAFSGVLLQPRTSAATGCSVGYFKCSDNLITVTSGTALSAIPNGAATYAVTRLLSSGNVFESSGASAVSTAGNTVAWFSSVNDLFKSGLTSGYIIRLAGTDVSISNGYFDGAAGTSRSAYYQNTGTVFVTNCVFKNLTFKSEISSATTYTENGCVGVGTILNTGGARLVTDYTSNGNIVAHGTAAPISGTWTRGDVVFDITPTAADFIGWVCVTGGTPGTWKTFGAISA